MATPSIPSDFAALSAARRPTPWRPRAGASPLRRGPYPDASRTDVQRRSDLPSASLARRASRRPGRRKRSVARVQLGQLGLHLALAEGALLVRAGARALLFPSLAEGYGLPLAEALAQVFFLHKKALVGP